MRVAWLVLLCPALALAQGYSPCGEIDDGARDYRGMTRRERLHIEGAHFTRDVEQLRRGKSASVSSDLDYTLRHIPNHPRALGSLMELARRQGVERVKGMSFSVSCYFERAAVVAPSDGSVRFSWGIYLMQKRDIPGARAQFDAAAELARDNPMLHYNLGLAYLDLGALDEARRHARIAYAAGGMPPGLARRLSRFGPWQE